MLLAEDEPTDQRMLQELLAHVGIEVDIAADGWQAIELARRRRYDLVLLDLELPVVDGVEAAKSIRALPGYDQTPLLAYTAHAFSDDRQACLNAGMDDHLAKPIEPGRLFEVLLKWLERPAPPPAPA